MRRFGRRAGIERVLLLMLVTACMPPQDPPAPRPAVSEVAERYLQAYFETFPTLATAAGRHDRDSELEDLDQAKLESWVAETRRTAADLRRLLADGALDFQDRLDAELLLRQAEVEQFDFETLEIAQRDPLFWSGIAARATLFLLVRDDLPRQQRLASAAARARQLPRLARQARRALAATEPAEIAPESCALAARQTAAAAAFYRQGFEDAAGRGEEELRRMLAEAGGAAAPALEELASFLEELATRASGSPRLGTAYRERFRLVTGVSEPVEEVLAQAEGALAEKLREAAAYGREVWPRVLPQETPPADDRELLARLFERVAADRAETGEEFVADYRRLIEESIEFVRRQEVITLPEPLPLRVERSPGFLVGQSVGGVYPAGPWAAPDAATLLFLPTPPAEASPASLTAFFRDFNHHFNVMITPHEFVPGHTLQLVAAARHPRKLRALFGDGVYIEGWGTFCERLMLDLGWGGPLDRLAHLKKQLENIARTVVDIRVHTEVIEREEVLSFVTGDALQDEQFAANMWRRSLTSAPQLTFYWLGYRQVYGLYRDVRAARGESFELRAFMDGMMELGPVPVRHYRERMLPRG